MILFFESIVSGPKKARSFPKSEARTRSEPGPNPSPTQKARPDLKLWSVWLKKNSPRQNASMLRNQIIFCLINWSRYFWIHILQWKYLEIKK